MKQTMLLILVLVLAGTSLTYGAGFLDRGTRSLRADATFDDQAGGDPAWGVEVGAGGGLVDLDDFGIFYGYNDNDIRRKQTIGIYVEEHYTLWSPVIPFIGLGTGWVYVEPDSVPEGADSSDEAWMVRGQVGIKILLRDNIALAGTFLYSWANDDVYFRGNPDSRGATNPEFSFGVRFYY